MQYFVVIGTIKNAQLMSQEKLKEHMAYTQKVMDQGLILFSGLKADQSGGVFLIKMESKEALNEYLTKEPFFIYGIQKYAVTEFEPHYSFSTMKEWFN